MKTRTVRWGLSAAVLVVAGLGLTACGPDDVTSSAGSSVASGSAQPAGSSATAGSAQPGARSTAGSTQGSGKAMPSAGKASGKASGARCTDRIDYAGDPRSNAEINSIGERTGHCPPVQASSGSGGTDAGDHRTVIGRLGYLAPGKLIVKPENGGTSQAFLVSNAVQILGAAAICGGPDGQVTIDANDYGTTHCTAEQLETAAKTSSVTVRVTLNPQSSAAETVAEKYHP